GKLETLKSFRSLNPEKYDVSINVHPQTRIHYRLAAWLISAPIRISHEYECFGMFDKRLVNRTVPQAYEEHTIRNNRRLLPLAGAEELNERLEMEIFLTPEEDQWAEGFLKAHDLLGRRKLGIHVGSGGTKNLRLKRWPLANYIELIRRLNKERPDLNILLFGGPEEVEDHEKILAVADRKHVFPVTSKNLREAAALIKRCDSFLSVDTALMHVASAVKVPLQIVIEAPTLNKTNLPFGNPYTLVGNPAIKGRHLEYYRFDGKDIKGRRKDLLALMAAVSVTRVLETVDRALPQIIR
ncbi:MAG TPA: glycosyltransferase family 9 protein, partial [Verrucomicrobiae bacterium]|nr:glycosyltransferase family 9 protein [Verrucomicrobiae bacterium]